MDQMTIGYDAKRAAQNRTGLGNYSRFVARIVRQWLEGCECVLYVPNPKRMAQLADLPQVERYRVVHPRSWLGRLVPALWRTVGIPRAARRDGVTLYHGLSNELPVGIRRAGCKVVVTIHDVIFIHQPEYYKPIDRYIYRKKMEYAGRVADRVITVSHFSKRELVQRLGIPEAKIEVVYPGIYLDFSRVTASDKEAVRVRYGLPERYVLYVGTIEERKNLMLVARGMAVLRERGALSDDMRVVVVGRRTAYADTLCRYLADHGLSDRFLMLHNVSFADLPACYLMADYLVYPSRIEGFGSPMLEAAAAGIPAIGCTGSSLEEAGGEGGFYVHPDDDGAMADSMLRLWTDEALRRERGTMGLQHAQRFADRRLYDDLLRVYRSVLNQ